MDHNVKKRLTWIEIYLETGDAGCFCRRCGLSRPTLRKRLQRYEKQGEDGLQVLSRLPETLLPKKFLHEKKAGFSPSKRTRSWCRRIQNELFHLHECRLSMATIHKVLARNEVKPLKRPKYLRDIPAQSVTVFRWIQ